MKLLYNYDDNIQKFFDDYVKFKNGEHINIDILTPFDI